MSDQPAPAADQNVPDRAASFRIIAVTYVIAVAAAWITWQLIDAHPAYALGAGLVAATIVTFIVNLIYDNGSVFDAWWSVLPPFAALWFTGMSDADELTPRQVAVHAVMWFWAFRLTTNWAVGWTGFDHEDWRYVRLKSLWPTPEWVVYLVAVQAVPTFFVWLGCLPLYPALALGGEGAFGWLDGLALAVGIAAVSLELAADEQMRAFSKTKKPGEIMDRGLWSLSRHPNYLGEIGFWVSMWLFGVAAEPSLWWIAAGPVAMIALFVFASIPLLDTRSTERRPGYAEYAARTPSLLPWPRAKNG